MTSINILLVSTLNYIEHLIPLINSIVNNVKISYSIYIYLVNVNIKYEINKIKKLSQNIIIRHLDIDLTDNEKVKSYSANIRLNLINNLLNEGKDYILYLDVDSIIRKDITHLIEKVKDNNYDLGLFTFKKKKDIQIKSGIILARNTNKAKVFFLKVENSLNKFGLYKWTSDQKSLKQVYHQVLKNTYSDEDKPKILKIKPKYLDWNFKETSIIWTGKGFRKYENTKYLEDKNYYINI
tara:strand:+ start:53 stop:766 length:714 start_codon:yes stop_codon:yes gene_type:complete